METQKECFLIRLNPTVASASVRPRVETAQRVGNVIKDEHEVGFCVTSLKLYFKSIKSIAHKPFVTIFVTIFVTFVRQMEILRSLKHTMQRCSHICQSMLSDQQSAAELDWKQRNNTENLRRILTEG